MSRFHFNINKQKETVSVAFFGTIKFTNVMDFCNAITSIVRNGETLIADFTDVTAIEKSGHIALDLIRANLSAKGSNFIISTRI